MVAKNPCEHYEMLFFFFFFFLFSGVSTLMGQIDAKTLLLVEQEWYYLTNSWRDKGVHAFPKGINLKGNVMVWLKFELTTMSRSNMLAMGASLQMSSVWYWTTSGGEAPVLEIGWVLIALAITPRSTLAWIGSSWSNRSVWKLFVLKKKTLYITIFTYDYYRQI